jgi:Bacterial regulatory proteins, lacI family
MLTVTLSRREKEIFVSQHHGLLTRVAKKCGVSHSLVSRVFHGLNTSSRVQKALNTEINRAIRKEQKRWAAKPVVPVTAPEEAVA